MKFIPITALLFLFNLLAHAELREVGYTLGPQLFREGDRIQIDEVKSTSSKFQIGETVTVKGRYNLHSHEAAKISLFVTQVEGDGLSSISPEQRQLVEKGDGIFELSIVVRHEGYLHVSFYPKEGGSGFGGVYFGKAKQMKAIEDWTLEWYLKESKSSTHTDRMD